MGDERTDRAEREPPTTDGPATERTSTDRVAADGLSTNRATADHPSIDRGSTHTSTERARPGSEESNAPAVGAVVPDRFSSDEVFGRIIAAADEEITSGSRELFFSALAAGFAITITFLLFSTMTAATGGDPVLSAMLYPLGFIYIVIGGYQLYTENTLPPVALTLERLASIPTLLRHWAVVLAGNFTGGAIGAAALAWGGVFSPAAAAAAMHHAEVGIATPATTLFMKATFAGLIVAGVVWVVYASQDTISRLVAVYLAFLAIPLGNLNHVVISFTEMLYFAFVGDLAVSVGLTEFVVPVLLGNTFGGIVLVTVVNYFQTSEKRLESARFDGIDRQLSVPEWLFGSAAGRSYVPLVNTGASLGGVGEDTFRILVPISNPRTESRLVDLACVLAAGHERAIVHAVHVVQVPDRLRVSDTSESRARIVAESEALMEDTCERTVPDGVAYETSTIVSHRSFQEVFAVAGRERADLVVMGWGGEKPWNAARAERPLDELTSHLPCDFLVCRDLHFDASRVLVPTAGGPDSDLSAAVARALRETLGSAVTLLRVVDGPDERERGEHDLAEWAEANDLGGAVEVVDDSGNVERAISRAAADHTLLILGATEAGLLSRLVTDSLHMSVINEVDCAVLLAERPSKRNVFERLFAR